MTSFSVDRIYNRREQVLSNIATVSLFPRLFLPKNRYHPKRAGRSSNEIFHFSRIRQGDSLSLAMARHEHFLFSQLYLRPKKTVLALFCGNGVISEQLVQFSDVNVVGVDTDVQLISSAKKSAIEAGLARRLKYHHAQDVCEVLEQFPDCSFDAVYAIEPGYRTGSPMTLYKHIERLLKPSGRFATYEWCFTDAMTPSNGDHAAASRNLLHSLPKVAKIDSINTITDLVSTLREAGLVNVAATDLALRDGYTPCWWYGQLSIEALLTAGRLRIFSPMVLVTGEKVTCTTA